MNVYINMIIFIKLWYLSPHFLLVFFIYFDQRLYSLYCTIHVVYCCILYFTVLYYAIMYYTMVCGTVQCYTVLYYAILYYTMVCGTVQCYTVLYYAYYTMLYCTRLYFNTGCFVRERNELIMWSTLLLGVCFPRCFKFIVSLRLLLGSQKACNWNISTCQNTFGLISRGGYPLPAV